MDLFLAGVSHKTAPVALRERYAFPESDPGAPLRDLVSTCGLSESLVISTCNRVEVVAASPDVADAERTIRAWLARAHRAQPEEIERHVYMHAQEGAVRHVFRVASSLDSMVVGEPQILGQIKDAYQAAAQEGTVGPLLNRLMHRAFSVAKRVRSETGVAEAAVSVSSVAVQLAARIFDTLADKRVVLLGAGEMMASAARHLRGQGVTRILVLNRTMARAQQLAEKVGGEAASLDTLADALGSADIVLGSLSDSPGLVAVPLVRQAMQRRANRTMFLIDIAVPRNVEPAVNELDNVYLYNLDDLAGLAEANARSRQAEAQRAEGIVREEAEGFMRWLTSLDAVPTIASLTAWSEEVRRSELEKALDALGPLSEEKRQVLEGLTSAIVRKLLHKPITRIKTASEGNHGKGTIATVKHLFDLDDE